LSIVGSLALAAYFILWALQTAWIGSFPGRDVQAYSVRFYWQLGAAVGFLMFALVVGVRYRRRRQTHDNASP
jgi:membrane protein implicated in regulation of membrane protease activity